MYKTRENYKVIAKFFALFSFKYLVKHVLSSSNDLVVARNENSKSRKKVAQNMLAHQSLSQKSSFYCTKRVIFKIFIGTDKKRSHKFSE